MSETTYTVLDLSGPVSRISFNQLLGEIANSSPFNTALRLEETQLRALVKVLFAYELHLSEVLPEQQPYFLESIKENEKGLFAIPQAFCEHLLNNLDQEAMLMFRELTKVEQNLKDLFANDEVMDFVEMHLIDPTISYWKWEYGRYALDHIGKEILGTVDWKTEQIGVVWDSIKIAIDSDNFDNDLERFGNELDDHEKGLLLLMVNAKVREQKSSLVEYVLAGDIIQSNLVGLQLRKEQLVSALKMTIENSRSRGKDRGGPKL